ncbi:MAG TPA: heat-inducible transcriptional repressor HrcA [Terriglobales bacterium]|jgi:heat-inducible transcriptional repressor|nr:heat-inducible transcriptional repressor HrcA [Terriglobales bacterium]
MAQSGQIGKREHEILTAIVETFISTGEPVGSRALARGNKEGLSPATIRNVMADLAEAGYLEQPHTSAGRVPTPEAYRYFVEQISGNAHLSRADEGLIQGSFRGVSDVQEFMERTSHVLSLISHGVGVAVTGTGVQNALEHVYFSRLGDRKILAVVVTRSGLVRDRLLRLERDLEPADLELAANFINENYRGWTLEAVRAEIGKLIERERSEYDRLTQSIAQLYQQGALAGDERLPDVYVEGAANLVANEKDRAHLSQLLKTLEEKGKVADLLAAYVDTRQEAVRVVIGLEQAAPQLRNFVLIGAPARVGDEVMGSLAVIGPTRMDYEHTITAVSYIARLFDSLLNERG